MSNFNFMKTEQLLEKYKAILDAREKEIKAYSDVCVALRGEIDALRLTVASLDETASYWKKVAGDKQHSVAYWQGMYENAVESPAYRVGKAIYEIVNEQRGVPRTPLEE